MNLTSESVHRITNRSVSTKLMGMFAGIIFLFGIVFIVMFHTSTLDLLRKQVELRAETATNMLAASILPHVAVGDYLSINDIVHAVANSSRIGYVTVINSKGMAIAGAFGEEKKFDPTLIKDAKQNGFPQQIIARIHLNKGVSYKTTSLSIGGQEIIEHALRLNTTDSEVHVGILTDELTHEVNTALIPYLVLLAIAIIFGSSMVFFSARSIT